MSDTLSDTDVLIIGSGAAGLGLALRLPESVRCTIVSKRDLQEGNTLYAQGGISAVLDSADSLESHVADTLNAGAGLCDEAVVRTVVERGPAAIRWLAEQGVAFTQTPPTGDSQFHLTREGGHSHRRVVHAADATGRAVETTLVERVRQRPNVTVLEYHIAVDLTRTGGRGAPRRCTGAYLLDLRRDRVVAAPARCVVLATGGAAKVYLYTSNPDVATGDGIAMAWRAGCRIANMEFIQFHPTCLYHPKAKSFLISEAVRGEGGRLLLPDGTRFMPKFDERAELAPRDIVARAIDHEMKRLGAECVYLDISHKPAAFIEEHFPTILARCLELGFDMRKEPLPVVPAAHYTCGGVKVDRSGETDIPGLFAIGETAYTGLHGANRMASNSLLECLVYSELAAERIVQRLAEPCPLESVPPWDESRVTDSDEEVVVSHNWDELRRFMWDYVGIVRSNKRLARARRRVDLLRREIDEYYGNFRVSNDLLELRNLLEVADLIVQSAQRRRESRGLHYNIDFPETDPNQAQPTVLIPDNYVPSPRG
ncbi:MAG: L-aspartate oxidase [Gammaproteobacteria bacterium]|nr:MAG: L-aspartate oxidase [Gammaproteobacteria bacterium]